MAGSSKSVNYNLRPCKSVERKMMCEMISRLRFFDVLSNYRYIGMGAKYFVDFALIHKEFGITKMFSMEKSSDEKSKEEFKFNKPYNCINMLFGNAGDLLNSACFIWENEKNIIWLDYDGGVTGKQLQDVETCIGKVESGSMIFVSFNSDLGEKFWKMSPDERINKISERIDNDELLALISKKDVARTNIIQTIHEWFHVIVEAKLSERNQIELEENKKMNCKQIAFFEYADSKATMLTLGWILYSNEDKEKFEKCSFEDLEFHNDTNIPYNISIPNFTYKEIALLNQNMPNVVYPIQGAEFISEEDIECFKKVYKYYPTMFETSIVL